MFDKLNLNGIPNRIIYDKKSEERYKLANEQEQFIVDRLTNYYPHIEWHTTTDFMGIMNPEQNRILGDIIGTRKNKLNLKPDVFIDLKVSDYSVDLDYIGGISINSILGFCYRQVNHYYLLVNADGSDWIIISGDDIYNLLMNKITKCLVESKYRTYADPKLDKFIDKFIYKKKFPGVSPKDFIPGHILRKYNKRK